MTQKKKTPAHHQSQGKGGASLGISSPRAGSRTHSGTPWVGLWLGLAAMIAVADQYTKTLILGYYKLGDVTRVSSFFNVTRLHNPGAAFSFLADAGGWQRWLFLGISVFAVCAIVFLLFRHGQKKLFSFALACIMGGAIGNLIDRSLHGYVVDFLDFHFNAWAPLFYQGHFPAFNLADAAITLGAFCLIADELLRVQKTR